MTQPIAERVWVALGAIEGLEEDSSKFSNDHVDRAEFVDGTQAADIVGGNTLGLRLTRRSISALRTRLKADPHIELRRSDWIPIRLDADVNLDGVPELAETTAAAHGPLARCAPVDAAARRRTRAPQAFSVSFP
jgi:hypothetical protein